MDTSVIKENKKLIMEMTGLDKVGYHQMIMEHAEYWLASVKRDLRPVLKINAMYWSWWMNHWYRIDQQFINELNLEDYRKDLNEDLKEAILGMYKADHIKSMRGLKPGAVVLKTAFRMRDNRHRINSPKTKQNDQQQTA